MSLADAIIANFGVPSPGAVNDKLIAYFKNIKTGLGSPVGVTMGPGFYWDLTNFTLYTNPNADNTSWVVFGSGAYASTSSVASLAAGAPAQRLICDSDVVVKSTTSTNAATLRRTERTRLLLVVQNLDGAEALNIAEGTLDSLAVPSSGYTSVAVGSEWVTTSALPVFAYFPTSNSTVRVYCEMEG